jgi:hypothetical protein
MFWSRTLDSEIVSSHRPADDVSGAAKYILIQRAELDRCLSQTWEHVHATRDYGETATTCHGSLGKLVGTQV